MGNIQQNTQLLAQLRDIHLPAPLSHWWPVAPGWYILIVLFMALCIIGIIGTRCLWQRHTRRHASRIALRQLRNLIHSDTATSNTNISSVVSQLLKRVALAYYPRIQVAGLHGMAWLKFLDATGHGATDFQQHGRILSSAPYQRVDEHNINNSAHLLKMAEHWIKLQR